MTDAILGGLAGLLLLVAAAVRIAALKAPQSSWGRAAWAVRAGAALAMVAALIASTYRAGGWWADDLWLLGLGLVLTALLVDEALAQRGSARCASPLVEALGAVLLGVLLYRWPAGQRPLLDAPGWGVYYARWSLYLVGAGSLMAAASAGLVGWIWQRQADREKGQAKTEMCGRYGRGATLLALFALGVGLVLGAWWFWQAQGQLTGDDPRETWLAIAWLIAGMGRLSWELEPRARQWAAALPVLAGLVAVAALLAAV